MEQWRCTVYEAVRRRGDKFRISTALVAEKKNASVRNRIFVRGGGIVKRSGSVFAD